MNELLRTAEKHLSQRDPIMARLIQRHGPCGLGGRKREPFHILTKSIISQQLSTKAADTIAARVAQHVGARGSFRPAHFLQAELTALRACGLSNAKAQWLTALALAADTGTLSFRKLVKMSDEEAIEMLDALPGVGRWTAEMFLMFAMNRLDLFSLGDIGLRRGVNVLYGGGRKLSDRRTLAIASAWAPYRTVACWYLWRSGDADDSWT